MKILTLNMLLSNDIKMFSSVNLVSKWIKALISFIPLVVVSNMNQKFKKKTHKRLGFHFLGKPVLECLIKGKIFRQIPHLQGPILGIVYVWHTKNKENGRKDKTNSFKQTRTFSLFFAWYMHKCILCDGKC